MANIIQDIINLDLESNEKVDKLQLEKQHLKKFFEDSKKSMITKYTNDMYKELETYKKKIEEDVKKDLELTNKQSENIKSKLQAKYKENLSKWIEEIYSHCIG